MLGYITLGVILSSNLIQFCCCIKLNTHNPAYVRLENGEDRCQGLVQFLDPTMSTLLQACNSDVGDSEAEVICRQLGCNSANARRVDSTRFGYAGAEYFTFFNYSCAGDETTLASCDALGSVDRTTSNLLSAVAADCGGEPMEANTDMNEVSNSKALVIIVGCLGGFILVVAVILDIAALIYFACRRNREAGLDLYIY